MPVLRVDDDAAVVRGERRLAVDHRHQVRAAADAEAALWIGKVVLDVDDDERDARSIAEHGQRVSRQPRAIGRRERIGIARPHELAEPGGVADPRGLARERSAFTAAARAPSLNAARASRRVFIAAGADPLGCRSACRVKGCSERCPFNARRHVSQDDQAARIGEAVLREGREDVPAIEREQRSKCCTMCRKHPTMAAVSATTRMSRSTSPSRSFRVRRRSSAWMSARRVSASHPARRPPGGRRHPTLAGHRSRPSGPRFATLFPLGACCEISRAVAAGLCHGRRRHQRTTGRRAGGQPRVPPGTSDRWSGRAGRRVRSCRTGRATSRRPRRRCLDSTRWRSAPLAVPRPIWRRRWADKRRPSLAASCLVAMATIMVIAAWPDLSRARRAGLNA